MTANQVKYLEYREGKRANLANEALTKARDQRSYHIALLGANETVRHNKKTENIQSGNLDETRRHNFASERITTQQFGETQRHNKQLEQLQGMSNLETRRSNLAREAENARHNVQTERENERSNRAREAENIRANDLGYLQNAERVKLGYAQVDLGYAQDLTNQDRNAITQGLGVLNARETNRSNVARENETRRHNVEQELQNSIYNDRKLFQDSLTLDETRRHNEAMERAAGIQAGAQAVRSVTTAFGLGMNRPTSVAPRGTQQMPTLPNEYVPTGTKRMSFGGINYGK